jgi:hypothetical protein
MKLHIFRFDLSDKHQQKRLEEMDQVFTEFGPASPTVVFLMLLPTFVTKAFCVGNTMKHKVHNLFRFFDESYIDHGKTYDPDHMRDFLDVYMSERKRVTEQGNTQSSFYGDAGHWNYLNTMFDFFLVR